MGCGRVGSTLAREPRGAQPHGLRDRQRARQLPAARARVQRRQGHRLRLRPGGPGEGRHPPRRRVRGRLERRQLQHHRRACRARDLRHRPGRRPHLRPRPRRGLPAARHHHRRHGQVDRRPGAAPAAAGRRRARLPRPVRHHPGRPGARARRPGSATRPSTSRCSPAVTDRLDRPARRGHAADARQRDPGGRPAPPGDARGERRQRLPGHRPTGRRTDDASRHRRSRRRRAARSPAS